MQSIAAQLQVLSASAPAQASKKVSSFLFEASVAADTDIQTIFSLGITGFSELRKIDPRFAPFEHTLFAGALGNPRAFDREGHSSKQLETLDTSIADFLGILSPYFLLSAAHKAIEFLIRRYRIHVFNIDSVLECILPFHETQLFARMLQILQIDKLSKAGAKWTFLLEAQKHAAPLARSTIVTRSSIDSSILEFLAAIVRHAVTLAGSVKSQASLFTAIGKFHCSDVLCIM
jgi:U3 small nucleolar RNA-associated protein 10